MSIFILYENNLYAHMIIAYMYTALYERRSFTVYYFLTLINGVGVTMLLALIPLAERFVCYIGE